MLEQRWKFRGTAGGGVAVEGESWHYLVILNSHIPRETAILLLALCPPNFSTHP